MASILFLIQFLNIR